MEQEENNKIDFASDLRNAGFRVTEPAFTWHVQCGYERCEWKMNFDSPSRIQIEYLDHIVHAHGVPSLVFVEQR